MLTLSFNHLSMRLQQLLLDRYDYLIAVFIIITAITWTMIGGKDLNWDQLNYHFYLPYSLINHRTNIDFLPANGQSYLNPISYMPFYWMVSHHWHSFIIAAILALLHSINVILVYKITNELVSNKTGSARIAALFAAILSFLSPVFLMEVGTTFADVTTSIFVLASILLALRPEQPSTWWKNHHIWSGFLIGIAVAMKLSNLVFVPSVLMLNLWTRLTALTFARQIILFCIGSIVGLLLVHGYWGYVLLRDFGNPFLPYFDRFFPTDIFPKAGAQLERFLPDSLADALLLPFRMMQLRAWIYVENVAPDLRFAALTTLLSASLIIALTRVKIGITIEKLRSLCASRVTAFCIFFISVYLLWILTSGNGRYGIVVSLLCGPMLAIFCFKVFRNQKVAAYALSILIALQIFHLSNGDLLWDRGSWTSSWYDALVPAKLQKEPYLYISIDGKSNSYIYPFLNHDSAFTNPIGQISFELTGETGNRLDGLFKRYAGRIRILSVGPNSDLVPGDPQMEKWYRYADYKIARLNFGIDRNTCEKITTVGQTQPASNVPRKPDQDRRTLISCSLYERPYKYSAERAHVTDVLKAVVSACPKLFKPAYTAPEQSPYGWSASYPSTDSTIIITKEGNIIGVFTRSKAFFGLGTIEQWDKGTAPHGCENIPSKPRKTFTFD